MFSHLNIPTPVIISQTQGFNRNLDRFDIFDFAPTIVSYSYLGLGGCQVAELPTLFEILEITCCIQSTFYVTV